jgi:hypothetical protein
MPDSLPEIQQPTISLPTNYQTNKCIDIARLIKVLRPITLSYKLKLIFRRQ